MRYPVGRMENDQHGQRAEKSLPSQRNINRHRENNRQQPIHYCAPSNARPPPTPPVSSMPEMSMASARGAPSPAVRTVSTASAEEARARSMPGLIGRLAAQARAPLRDRISASSGTNAAWQGFHVVKDQKEGLRHDVAAVRSHPLIEGRAQVAGFIYDVDSGLLNPLTD